MTTQTSIHCEVGVVAPLSARWGTGSGLEAKTRSCADAPKVRLFLVLCVVVGLTLAACNDQTDFSRMAHTCILADSLLGEGLFSEAEVLLEAEFESISNADALGDDPRFVPLLDRLATAYLFQEKLSLADSMSTDACRIIDKATADTLIRVEAMVIRARVSLSLRRYSEAEKQFNHALALLTGISETGDPTVAYLLESLSIALLAQEKTPTATAMREQALRSRVEREGLVDSANLVALDWLATMYVISDRYEEAEDILSIGSDAAKRLGSSRLQSALNLNLCNCYYRQREYMKAIPVCSTALQAAERCFGVSANELLPYLRNYAAALYYGDHAGAAIPLHERILTIAEASLGENHVKIAQYLAEFAGSLEAAHEERRADKLINRAKLIVKRYEDSVATLRPPTPY